MSVSLESKPGQQASGPYLRYAPSVERYAPEESAIFDQLSQTLQHITRTMASRYRHAYRPIHAKSHGLLVGTLKVRADLPEHLAQGLFSQAGSYPIVMRFSTNPGDLLADNVSTPRGLAVKVLGNTIQDFVCVAADVFPAPNPAAFLKQIQLFDKNLKTPEGVKHAVSLAARAANAVLGVVGAHSGTLEGVGTPAVNILGESFTTVAPLRYGNYVAKLGIGPASANLKALAGKSVDLSADYNALEELIKKFFAQQSAVWDVKVQLALAPGADSKEDKFPIEDASKRWPPEESPWQTVAQIVAEPQDSYSDARQRFVDEQLSFNPWHCLPEHQPLGGIMRARRKAYEEAAKYRARRNGWPEVTPKSLEEIPD